MTIKDNRGFTLVELIVVMAIFVVVVLLTTSGFNTAITQLRQQSKSLETNIGSIIGLELFRTDLQNAGYGLPWAFQATPSSTKYTEVEDGDETLPSSLWPSGMSPEDFNDAGTTSGLPRAIMSGNTEFNKVGTVGSQYIVVKSLSVAPGLTQKKWATVTYGDAGRNPITTYGSAERDLTAGERVIVLRNTFVDGVPSRQLQVMSGTSAGTYSTTFGQYTTLTQPHSSGDVFEVYGVADGSVSDLRMPFNRADYYVRTPANMPPACAPHTGILYKAVANQASGFAETPLLDCVADMQVVYSTGSAGNDLVTDHSTSPPATARELREQLKEIRVYILAHEGKRDPTFKYPQETITVGEEFAGVLRGRVFSLKDVIGADDYLHYRWKLYTIVVRPKNLIQ